MLHSWLIDIVALFLIVELSLSNYLRVLGLNFALTSFDFGVGGRMHLPRKGGVERGKRRVE